MVKTKWMMIWYKKGGRIGYWIEMDRYRVEIDEVDEK